MGLKIKTKDTTFHIYTWEEKTVKRCLWILSNCEFKIVARTETLLHLVCTLMQGSVKVSLSSLHKWLEISH